VADLHHITVLYDVLLSLQTPAARLFGFCNGSTMGDEVIEMHHLGSDEFGDEIRVDHAR
jgi:hypothetical protein